MERHWTAFEARVLQPSLYGCEPRSITELLDDLGGGKPQDVYDMVKTIKRRLRCELRSVVAETVADTSELDDELATIRRYLAST